MILWFTACGTSAIEDGWSKNGLTTIKDGYVSAFSIDSEQGLILIDAGGKDDASSITSSLSAQECTPNDVEHIFLTHAHTDHVAGLSVFSNARTYAMPDEHDRIEEEQEVDISQNWKTVWSWIWVMFKLYLFGSQATHQAMPYISLMIYW